MYDPSLLVPKRLAIAQLPNRATVCCSPRAKLRAKDVAPYAVLFRALADETRLDILGFLAAAGDAICVCEIEDHVKLLSQPTISHHLRQLREAGLVTAERRGTWIYYAVDKSMRARLTEFVALFKG
jgi:ArsR family transcriptional regulator